MFKRTKYIALAASFLLIWEQTKEIYNKNDCGKINVYNNEMGKKYLTWQQRSWYYEPRAL